MTEPVYLCVHLPEFPAQALLRLRGVERRQGVAVVEGVAPLERVCSMNRRAGEMGVRRGMTKAELDSFGGDLMMLRRSAEEERAAKAAVMEVAGGFTPRVEDLTAGPHATEGACVVVLDVAGTERLFGPAERLAKQLLRALRGIKLMGRVAVSGNLLTAVVAARHEVRTRPVWVVNKDGEADALGALPLHVLMLTETQAETFGAWGLRTLGELAMLDEVDVVVRLGQEGGRLWRLSRGRAEHLMIPVEAGLRLEEVVEFDAAVEGMEPLMFALGPMLDQLIARAGNRALELASVRVEMGLDRHGGGEEGDGGNGCGGEHVRVIKPALPVGERGLLLKLLLLDLEAHPPGTGVVRLRVTAEAGRRGRLQTGLFRPQMPEAGRLEVTLARIAAMVGEGRVGRVRLRDSHAAESFAMERFVLPAIDGVRGASARRRSEERTERKLWELEHGTAVRGRREEEAVERAKSQGTRWDAAGCFAAPSGLREAGDAGAEFKAVHEDAEDAERTEGCRSAASGRKPAVITIGSAEVMTIDEERFEAIRVHAGNATNRLRATVEGNEAGSEAARSKVLRMPNSGLDAMARVSALERSDGDVVGESGSRSESVCGSVAGRMFAVGVRRMRPQVPIRWTGGDETAFWMQGVLYTVRERYGPWRRSGAWWTGEVWSEEEWDVAVEAGAGVRLLCVLTHDLLRDRWHMGAVYD